MDERPVSLVREIKLYNDTATNVLDAARRCYPNVRWGVHLVDGDLEYAAEDPLFVQQLYEIQIALKLDHRPSYHRSVPLSRMMIEQLAEEGELRMVFSTMLRRVADDIMDVLLAGEFPPAGDKAQRRRDYQHDLLGGAKWRWNWENIPYV